ncbi:hypothetical protein BDK51DRAFT_29219, partial [Blyttiomyces helicus]
DRPETLALTGGYRRIPVMQIGSDIYADTALILDELDRRFPERSLIPVIDSRRQPGVDFALRLWTDRVFFPLLPWTQLPRALHADREKMSNRKIPLDPSHPSYTLSRAAARESLAQIEAHLAHAEPTGWILPGPNPTSADVHLAMNVWFLLFVAGQSWVRSEFPRVVAWVTRLHERAGMEFGAATGGIEMGAEDAVEVAMVGESCVRTGEAHGEVMGAGTGGVRVGDVVDVAPSDYGRDATRGTVVRIDADRVVVRRRDDHVGVTTTVHFPRSGYVVRKARIAKL